MNLNDDFSRRVAVHAARLPWAPSPTTGIDRRMLDRIGDEVARATTVVRYAEGSRFPSHIHDGGEEILVLEGDFCDETGTFPAGTYLRNPPGSRHAPGSATGCVILVKLRQFHPLDAEQVRIDASCVPFVDVSEREGVVIAPLYRNAHEDVRIERWAPDAVIRLLATVGMELLVIDGDFEEQGALFERESWLRLPAGAELLARAGKLGAKLWVKLGRYAPT
ncbi:cupin [Mesorhizobium sp. M8A.F.Ca.ET.173.01.1.1]|nr:cupin [Mesorhizobium sp. M8A.F.Ca.ET.173.01.1.1]